MTDIVKTLKEDEGLLLKATHIKTQTGGQEKNLTIGYGYNIDAANDPVKDMLTAGVDPEQVEAVLKGRAELNQEQADVLLNISAQRAARDAERVIPRFESLPDPVKKVMVEMSYQLGAEGLRGFKQMRGAVARGDYEEAAKQIMNSAMARKDSTARSKRHAKALMDYTKTPEYKESGAQPQRSQSRASREEALRDRKRQLLIQRAASSYNPETRMADLAKGLQGILQAENKTTTEDSTNGGS